MQLQSKCQNENICIKTKYENKVVLHFYYDLWADFIFISFVDFCFMSLYHMNISENPMEMPRKYEMKQDVGRCHFEVST